MRGGARRLAFGLMTLSGLKPRGFFIPYRYAGEIPPRAKRAGYPELLPVFAAAEPAFRELLAQIDAHSEALRAIGEDKPPEPRWRQDWFPRLDAATAYVMVRERKPRHIVEVGSGHSTRFLARAIRDGGLAAAITCIDPAPRASIEGLGVTMVRKTAQEADPAIFVALEPGDILFIDSSHILMPGTDVDALLNRVLPALPAGVLIHVHDIFLPDGYPPEWEWRGYNEQLAIAALLQGGAYRLLWSSRHVATRMAYSVETNAAGALPLLPSACESSLWLMKS